MGTIQQSTHTQISTPRARQHNYVVQKQILQSNGTRWKDYVSFDSKAMAWQQWRDIYSKPCAAGPFRLVKRRDLVLARG